MKQAWLKHNLNVKKTCKQVFLDQMAQSGAMGGAARAHRAVLPRRQGWPATIFFTNHAARSLHAAVVHAVRSGQGGSLFLACLCKRGEGAPDSGDPSTVRMCESMLLRLKEEYRPTHHAVCAVIDVGRSRQTDRSGRINFEKFSVKSRHLKNTDSLRQLAVGY